MSTLKVDTIRDGGAGFNDVVTFANSVGTENGRLCRAFVNFNGVGAVAIRASFNVNSIAKNGTGDYTVNFSNAMSDANYCVAFSVGGTVGTLAQRTNTQTASAIQVFSTNFSSTSTDVASVFVAIFR